MKSLVERKDRSQLNEFLSLGSRNSVWKKFDFMIVHVAVREGTLTFSFIVRINTVPTGNKSLSFLFSN